jgi:hypothetical protein
MGEFLLGQVEANRCYYEAKKCFERALGLPAASARSRGRCGGRRCSTGWGVSATEAARPVRWEGQAVPLEGEVMSMQDGATWLLFCSSTVALEDHDLWVGSQEAGHCSLLR